MSARSAVPPNGPLLKCSRRRRCNRGSHGAPINFSQAVAWWEARIRVSTSPKHRRDRDPCLRHHHASIEPSQVHTKRRCISLFFFKDLGCLLCSNPLPRQASKQASKQAAAPLFDTSRCRLSPVPSSAVHRPQLTPLSTTDVLPVTWKSNQQSNTLIT